MTIIDYEAPKRIDPKKIADRALLSCAGVSGDVPLAVARLQIGQKIEAANDNSAKRVAA